MKSYSEFDVVDYIEASDEDREDIDGEFAGVPAELAAMHVVQPEPFGSGPDRIVLFDEHVLDRCYAIAKEA